MNTKNDTSELRKRLVSLLEKERKFNYFSIEIKEILSDGTKKKFFAKLLELFINLSFSEEEAKTHWENILDNYDLTLLCQIRNRFRSLIIQRTISYDRHSQWMPAYACAFLRVAVLLPPMWSLYEEVKSLGCKRYRSNSITDNRL